VCELDDVPREIGRDDLKLPLARVREELTREIRGAARGFDAVAQHLLGRALGLEHQRGGRDGPLDGREHVVEVVRDPAGEQPEALELLDVEKPSAQDHLLLLRAARHDEIGHVERVQENAVDRAAFIA